MMPSHAFCAARAPVTKAPAPINTYAFACLLCGARARSIACCAALTTSLNSYKAHAAACASKGFPHRSKSPHRSIVLQERIGGVR